MIDGKFLATMGVRMIRTDRHEAMLLVFASLIVGVLPFNVFITVTYGEGSHYVSSTAIGEALVKRGHNVTYLISNAYEYRARHPVHSKLFRYEIFNHSVPVEKVYRRTREIAAFAFQADFNTDIILSPSKWLMPLVWDCRAALSDKALMGRLRDAKFDITIVDLTWGCSILLNAYVGTPTVFYNPLASQYFVAELAGAPFMPAIIPEGLSGTPQRMNFWQRLKSLVINILGKYFIMEYFVGIANPLRHEFGIMEEQTMAEFLEKSVLTLTNSDPVIDLVAPMPPSVIEVGGLLTRPANKLTRELDDFMNGAGDEGVIVFSLGTYVKAMPQRYNDLFASVFARLPQKVVWQLPDGTPTKLTDNIKTMEWLPQNDLLGHPQTRLFMYQGGNNGLYEALYHGVPIVVLPVFSDQLSVAARVTEKGMGVSLSIHSITAESLEAAITTVTQNSTYMKTAKRLSAIYRDRPQSPADRAAFWVEHVMKYGGKHLRSPVKDLNFVQLYLIDVYAFLFTCLLLFIVIFYYTCKLTYRCCKLTCRRVIGSKPKQD
ncbi:UDP-glucuronosyltransferase 2C1-like [Diadema setosum]|uniref:UDP-glucuronosyltransferase 2C1-like n=1 Tax=Diadema setosum TaxID=31175 RepID=UPI003B3B909A